MGFKVVSGGQTGVDRAALDVALAMGVEVGGWCPRGRWAEDGPIPEHYPLSETKSTDAHVRTQRNVEASTATLVLTRGSPMGGVRYTVEIAESIRRPLLMIDLNDGAPDHIQAIATWLDQVRPAVLNVAGPRESGAPGVSEQTKHLLKRAFERSTHATPTPPASSTAGAIFSSLLAS